MYSCQICNGKNFTTPQAFYKHLIEHKSKHGCKKCDGIFKAISKRRTHINKHGRTICNICNTEYDKLYSEEHTKSHEYLYSVDQLNGIVDIINEIQDLPTQPKRRKTTNNITKYQGTEPNCPVTNCEKKFNNQNDLIHHFIHHRNNHLCQFCDEIFPNDKSYESHSVNKICRAYSCHNCAKEFSFQRFIHHITSECENKNLFDNMDVEPVQIFTNRKVYRAYDQIQYTFTCFVCEEEFQQLELLNDHLKTHNKELHVCAMCFCVFDAEQELQDHVTIGCKNTEEIPANIREKLTNEIEQFLETQAKRKNHLVANKKVYEMSDNSVLFQCNTCGSKFVKFSYLKEHCAKFNHELIMCYKCLYLFNTWNEFREHYCMKLDYNSFGELEFRQQFQKCIKRKCEIQAAMTPKGKPFERDCLHDFLENDDDVRRMSVLINQLENTKFTNINGTKFFKDDTPSTSAVNSNDDYDLNKILPRILARRNKRLFQKPDPDEDSEEEIEIIGNNLHDLDICKKHLLINNDEYDLDKVLPRIIKLRNKRHFDEALRDINKFLKNLESDENLELGEPPNKRNKYDDDSGSSD